MNTNPNKHPLDHYLGQGSIILQDLQVIMHKLKHNTVKRIYIQIPKDQLYQNQDSNLS